MKNNSIKRYLQIKVICMSIYVRSISHVSKYNTSDVNPRTSVSPPPATPPPPIELQKQSRNKVKASDPIFVQKYSSFHSTPV